jgi:choline dehydrogenase-like flavoprotein
MFSDARTLPDGTTLQADLAIIGGGAAGITLARSLASTRIRICIVEAGGLEFNQQVQSLYEGKNLGLDYSTIQTRLRYFGGSTNHWGGYCRPLDPIDFERRDWIPHSGWPFAIDELLPYYDTACHIVEVAPGRFADRRYWEQATGETIPDLASGRMRLRFVQFSPPTRFGSRYRDELLGAENIDVLLNANVTGIIAAGNAASIDDLEIRTLTGLRHSVKARCYVLAAGGLENARLLLLSNDVMQAGLGNQHDLVGRFFMEHVHLAGFGELVIARPARVPKILYERVSAEGRSTQAAINPSAAFLRQQQLLNATFMVGLAGIYRLDEPSDNTDERSMAHLDMLKAAQGLLNDHGKAAGDEHIIGAWLGMGSSCEQVPNPDSRVSLSSQRDPLGLPRISLDWRLTEQDRLSFYRHLHSLALEAGAMGIGRMRLNIDDESNWPQPVNGGSHHMGTTRMSDSPNHGVVDRNCRVHGVENLYIAGSSVFPTAGAANPTLTITALTLRLSDHLREKMR